MTALPTLASGSLSSSSNTTSKIYQILAFPFKGYNLYTYILQFALKAAFGKAKVFEPNSFHYTDFLFQEDHGQVVAKLKRPYFVTMFFKNASQTNQKRGSNPV